MIEKLADRLTISAPLDATIAPPTYYMLFLINDQGVPSEAVFVQVALPPIEEIT